MFRSRGTTATFIGISALVAFSALTAVPASAGQSGMPSDCSLSTPSSTAVSMTCTSRPATQTWWADTYCLNSRGLWIKEGTKVTGDGTSTVDCVAYPPYGPTWFASSS